MAESMLTTTDNPFDPFTEFNEWYAFDEAAGYRTLSFLARVARNSSELSDADQSVEIERAIDEICQHNVLGIYRKVSASA